MGGLQLIDIEQKRCELVIHGHDCDLLVTKGRCMDLLDSDRGDLDVSMPSTSQVWINFNPSMDK